MNITNITNYCTFKAGKVHVFSDFDGTYCPAKHSSLHYEGQNNFMKEYCSKMDKFFKATNGDLHFHITTGRTFGEFEAISYLLRIRNFFLPLPESFISKNGSDEFIKNGSDEAFYKKGIFPYKYSEPNKKKELEIKKLTNWDGENLKTFIKNLAIKYRLKIIYGCSEHSVKDYGENALFSEKKLNPDEWRKLPMHDGNFVNHKTPVADFIIGSRLDGNLKVNLIFSPDYGVCEERNYVYDNFMNEIKNYLNENHVDYIMDWEIPQKNNHYRNHCNITPRINGSTLTKLFDTKTALRNAVKDNDIVVIAGDGSNDFDMLNPLEYIEQQEWDKYKSNSKCKYFYNSDMQEKLLYIRNAYEGKDNKLKQELESNGLAKQLREMPLFSIIVDQENSSLKSLKDTFERFGKVITIKKGNLDEGIKNAIKEYAKKQSSFRTAMSDKMQKYIFGSTKEKGDKILIYTGIIIAAGLGLGAIYKTLFKPKEKNTANNK